ncbi:MAG: hypothetical protein ACC657_05530 [Thiohalomonadales bacterium]
MSNVQIKITGINSEWLARDNTRYIVRIPTAGGSGNFGFKEYGGSQNALKAAKKFQKAMLRQLEFDRNFHMETGDYIAREHLHVNNKSGVTGVCRIVCPNGYQNPRIEWVAQWSGKSGKRYSKTFSTADPKIKNEQDAKQKAIAYRKEKTNLLKGQ